MALLRRRARKKEWRILLVGDEKVGKTTFMHRFVDGHFVDAFADKTPIHSERCKNIRIGREAMTIILYDNWDIHMCYGSIEQSIRRSQGFILLYSVDQRQSFENLVNYCKQIRQTKADPDVPFVLVGIKCDLRHERVVPYEAGARLAYELGCEFFETSAQTGENIEAVIVKIARMLGERGQVTNGPRSHGGLKGLLCFGSSCFA